MMVSKKMALLVQLYWMALIVLRYCVFGVSVVYWFSFHSCQRLNASSPCVCVCVCVCVYTRRWD